MDGSKDNCALVCFAALLDPCLTSGPAMRSNASAPSIPGFTRRQMKQCGSECIPFWQHSSIPFNPHELLRWSLHRLYSFRSRLHKLSAPMIASQHHSFWLRIRIEQRTFLLPKMLEERESNALITLHSLHSQPQRRTIGMARTSMEVRTEAGKSARSANGCHSVMPSLMRSGIH